MYGRLLKWSCDLSFGDGFECSVEDNRGCRNMVDYLMQAGKQPNPAVKTLQNCN